MSEFKDIANNIIKILNLTKVKYFFLRMIIAVRFIRNSFSQLTKWLFKSNELTNFTYDLQENNLKNLASLIADIVNIDFNVAMSYIKELEEDSDLREHIKKATINSNLSHLADENVKYGRRVGWYLFVRALKPKIIVETGVDKGLGACVLTAALKRNKDEGFEGEYFGTDLNNKSGYLLSGEYARYGSILYGDSIESLKKFNETIDLFINDSDHNADYEAEEYNTIANKLSENAVVLSDNSHSTDKLLMFSHEMNRHFIFFQEKPSNHWYPGAGIGISFVR